MINKTKKTIKRKNSKRKNSKTNNRKIKKTNSRKIKKTNSRKIKKTNSRKIKITNNHKKEIVDINNTMKIIRKIGGGNKKNDDMNDNKKDDKILTECLKHLNNPYVDKTPPKICYNKLDFPNDKQINQIGSGPSHLFFKEAFPKLITVSEKMVVHNDMKINVPDDLRDFLVKTKYHFVIIPINFKDTNNYYAILLDNKNQEWQIFIPPGNKEIPNNDKLEVKIRTLIDDHLKLPVRYFYECIKYKPKPNTVHFDYWPSWIIYQRIKKSEQREIMVNSALEKLLRKSPEYTKFIKDFNLFLTK